jgi:hypothetical protein
VSGLVVWVLLFGTLGLQRLLTKTTQFQNFKNFKKIQNFHKISNFPKISIFQDFKIFKKFLN